MSMYTFLPHLDLPVPASPQYCSLDDFNAAYEGLQALTHDYTLAQRSQDAPARRLEPV